MPTRRNNFGASVKDCNLNIRHKVLDYCNLNIRHKTLCTAEMSNCCCTRSRRSQTITSLVLDENARIYFVPRLTRTLCIAMAKCNYVSLMYTLSIIQYND